MTSIRKSEPRAVVAAVVAPPVAPCAPSDQRADSVASAHTGEAKTPPSDAATTVPNGGEALSKRDIARLTRVVLELDATKLPERLHATRAMVEARLPFLLSDLPAARIVHEDGHDHLLFGDVRCRLADKATFPGVHAPVTRIAAIANSAPADKPLLGLRIALDPGHFSGLEDMVEGKFVTGGPPPEDTSTVPADGITEGELTVASAQNLAARLRALGATVTITHQGIVNRTQGRADLAALLDANPDLKSRVPNPGTFITSLDLERRAERLSAPTPDMVIAMHFDAEQHQVTATARNEVKCYVPGSFTSDGFASSQQRARFALQLQSHSWEASADLAKTLVRSICDASGAIPQLPSQTGAVNPRFLRPVGSDTGVFARNLRMPAAVRGEPLNVYLEGATYNHPDVYPKAFADRGSPMGLPGGFVDTYAKSIADGILRFVSSKRQHISPRFS